MSFYTSEYKSDKTVIINVSLRADLYNDISARRLYNRRGQH
jgi:hypothetical protein